MIGEIITYIAVGVITIILVPFIAYLWGRSQASGWIEAFKKSNLTINNKEDNGKTKEK